MLLSKVPDYFKARRESLYRNHPGSVFIFPANPLFLRNEDVHYSFRQESHFFYLSGFEEPESFLVLAPSKNRPGHHRMILFVLPRDPEKEMWEGERYGIEGAQQVFGADEAYPSQEFDQRLPEILQGADRVFYRFGFLKDLDARIVSALEKQLNRLGRSGRSLLPVQDPRDLLGEMRLFKSSEELELLRKACRISAGAHRAAMKACQPGMNEAEIEALVDYEFRKNGCQRVGYGSIVAGGKNATCLHYRSNNDRLNDGELLLIDAGGEYDYYTADITRTFPIGKQFSKIQAKVYDLVLNSQKEAISMVRPGAKLPDLHKRVCEVLVEGFLSLGLMTGNVNEIIKKGEHRRYYPHNTSHWLGIDVHDVGLYMKNQEPRPLEPGMVFTIEPGFYVQPSDRQTPEEYRSIGIRIEDNIYVTPEGCEVLTKDAPKERGEIESLK